MIKIIDKHNCCGCEACVNACPKQCISFKADDEGFCYPIVDETICVGCGACERTCPILTPNETRKPSKQIAAINPNSQVRAESSSGGIFSMLAEKTIEAGGVVFGVRFDDNWQAVFDYTETIEGLVAFRGSKYIQARVGRAFADARDFLKQGRKVLFTGTSCQIAAMRHFLNRDYDNLLLVDIICHGVPSPKVWGLYLNEVTHNAARAISDVQFRNKKQGWKRFNFDLTYDHKGKKYSISSWFLQNHYMRIFLQDVILRPSCYDCKAKAGRSGSDMTIADFWGIDRLNPQMDDDGGTSLVLVYTDKGAAAMESLQVPTWETQYSDVLRFNPSIEKSKLEHPKRSEFFRKLDTTNSVVKLIDKTLQAPLPIRVKQLPRQVAGKIYKMFKKIVGGGTLENSQIENSCSKSNDKIIISKPSVKSVTFRSKMNSWKRYCMLIEFSDDFKYNK